MTAVALALLDAVQAVGGTLALDGANLRVRAPAPLSEVLRASLRQHKPALVAFLAETAANANPPVDRAGTAAVPEPAPSTALPPVEPGPWSAGLPDAVARGLGAVLVAPAARGILDRHWRTIVTDTLAFVDSGQAARAFALGWTAAGLFGCDHRAPWPRLDRAGLMLLVEGREIAAITPEHIALRHRDGSVLRFRRSPTPASPPVAMLWHLLPARLRPHVGPAP